VKTWYRRALCWCAAATLAPVALVAQATDPGAPPRTGGPRAGTLPSENESLAALIADVKAKVVALCARFPVYS
jgi:hypothetical protein